MDNKYGKMNEEELYKLAQKRVHEKRDFISHLATYIVVCTALGIFNYFFLGGYLWFKWVVFGWGIGIVSHGISLFNTLRYNVDAVEREMEKLKKIRK